MNYSIPVMRISQSNDKLKFNKRDLNDILDQQVIISQMSTGITFTDTDNMDEYERLYVINKLIQLKKEENEAKKKAIEEARNRK